eukprot:2772387-Prymnesium_polylepis.2
MLCVAAIVLKVSRRNNVSANGRTPSARFAINAGFKDLSALTSLVTRPTLAPRLECLCSGARTR